MAKEEKIIQNRNKVSVKELPTYKGKKALKVLHISIGEKNVTYRCIMDDGTIQNVPASLFSVK